MKTYHESHNHAGHNMGGIGEAVMLMCLGVILLIAFVPMLGFPVGPVVALAAAAIALLVLHSRLMGHFPN